jgi:hypothetical protein
MAYIIASIWLSIGVVTQWLSFLFKRGKNTNDWYYLIMVVIIAFWATLKMEDLLLFGLVGVITGMVHGVIETHKLYKKIDNC